MGSACRHHRKPAKMWRTSIAGAFRASAPNVRKAAPPVPRVTAPVRVGLGTAPAAGTSDPSRQEHITSVPTMIGASCFMGERHPFTVASGSGSHESMRSRRWLREYAPGCTGMDVECVDRLEEPGSSAARPERRNGGISYRVPSPRSAPLHRNYLVCGYAPLARSCVKVYSRHAATAR